MGEASRWVATETYDKLAPVPAAQAPVACGKTEQIFGEVV